MTHTLFPSVDALLAPATLSRLTGQPVTGVTLRLLTPEFGRSGSRILAVITNDGEGPRLILKRVALAWDWLMRTTEDTRCRSVTLWQAGLFDQLPAELAHGVLACARDGDGWAILMHDVGDMLVLFDPFTEAENVFFLNAMAALHARFWQSPALHDPALGLCRLDHLYRLFAPATARAELDDDNAIPRHVVDGWEQAQRTLPADVWATVERLLADPAPLCRALARYPVTLVHGDWRHANQACAPGVAHLIMLDWQLAAVAPPAVDLARYLITNSPLLPGGKDRTIAHYRAGLAARLGAAFADAWWTPQLALALLGGFVQDGWALVLKATTWHVGAKHRDQWQADLPWWIERVREGVGWLEEGGHE